MKKRVFLFILSCLLLSAMALAFSACGKVECTVSFMVDDTVYATITTNGKEALKMPGDPAKEGLVFDGWYWDKDSWQKPFTAGSLLDVPLSETLTVYARFKEKPLSGTEISAPGYTVDGKSYSISVPSTTEQYSFIDVIHTANDADFTVCTDMECTNLIPSKTTQLVRGDNVFYILVTNGKLVDVYTFTVRRRPVYTVSFQTNGSAIPSQDVEEGSFATMPTQPTREGYVFAKWAFDFSTPITDNTVITAVWAGDTYIITLDAAGGNVSETTQTVTFDAEVNLPVPTKEFYQFLGWYYGETKIEGAWRIASDVTLTARWLSCFKITSDGTITGLREFDETLTDLVIPRKIDDITVTSIGDGAFSGCTELTNITIPDSVTSIGDGAFSGCTELTNITIPDSVTSIGNEVFSGCTNLTSVTIPNSVTSIGEKTFYSCTGLTSITISNNVKDIGTSLLENCSNLTSFTIPNGVTRIGAKAFYGCARLSRITIPNSIKSVGNFAFSGCMNLTSITIPDSVSYIGDGTFFGCTGLTRITIPSGVENIGSSTFYGCSNLTSFTIPNGVTIIGARAFYGCTGLATIIIPSSVTYIGWAAFYGCTSLTSVTIPDDITHIGEDAFYNCPIESATIPALACSFVVNKALKTVLITSGTRIGGNAFSNCKNLTSITIPNSVTSIGDNVFYGCANLMSITVDEGNTKYHSAGNCLIETATRILIAGCKTSIIPMDGSVTSIGNYAFYGCTSLTSITIPDSVTSIGWLAFNGCMSLTSIKVDEKNTEYHSEGNCLIETATKTLIVGCKTSIIPTDGSVTSIGNYAFLNCTSLTSIAIPNSVTSIEADAFYGCTSLTSITIPNSVTSIGDFAFYGCTSLTSIIIGNGLTSIGSQAFDDCFRLVEVYNLSTLTIKKGSDANGYVGRYALVIHTSLSEKSNLFTDENGFAFYEDGENCYLLGYTGNETVLILPQSCHGKKYAIYQYAFYNCTSLTSITLPNGVTSIGGYVFCGCMSLTSIAIPNSVTSIGDYAFCGCMSLTSIAIPNSVTSIGNYAFSGCTNLTSITISDSVTSIKSWAFSGCTSLTSIHFQGTKAEWNQINKRDGWNYNTGNYTVHCTDGDIAKQ